MWYYSSPETSVAIIRDDSIPSNLRIDDRKSLNLVHIWELQCCRCAASRCCACDNGSFNGHRVRDNRCNRDCYWHRLPLRHVTYWADCSAVLLYRVCDGMGINWFDQAIRTRGETYRSYNTCGEKHSDHHTHSAKHSDHTTHAAKSYRSYKILGKTCRSCKIHVIGVFLNLSSVDNIKRQFSLSVVPVSIYEVI